MGSWLSNLPQLRGVCQGRSKFRLPQNVTARSPASHENCVANSMNPSSMFLRTFTFKSTSTTLGSNTSIIPKNYCPTSVERLRDTMAKFQQRKWGFIFFRCTYGDDDAWKRFMDRIMTQTIQSLQNQNGLFLLKSLDVKVEEDHKILDGASFKDTTKLFNLWKNSDEAKAEGEGRWQNGAPYGSRYFAYVHVDKESLDSVLDANPDDWRNRYGWVYLVDSEWSYDIPTSPQYSEEDIESILEDREEWPGYMRSTLLGLMPSTYEILENVSDWPIYVRGAGRYSVPYSEKWMNKHPPIWSSGEDSVK